MTTTLTGKNQITLPADLVRKLGLKPGARFAWSVLRDGSMIARPLPSRGALARRLMGLAAVELKPGADPIKDLQKIQEDEDPLPA